MAIEKLKTEELHKDLDRYRGEPLGWDDSSVLSHCPRRVYLYTPVWKDHWMRADP